MKLAAASSMNGSLSLTVSGSAAPRRLLSSSGVFGAVWDVLIIASLLPLSWTLRKDVPADDDLAVLEVGPDPQRPLRVPRSIPLRAFRDTGIVHLVDRQVLRVALDGHVTPGAGHARYADQSGHVIHVVPLVKVALLLGWDVQPHGEDKIRVPCRLRTMREDLPVDANRGVAEVGTHFLRPVGRHLPHLPKSVALQHVLIGQVVERQIFGLALDGQIPAPTKKARHPKELRDVLGVVPVVKLTLHFWSDIGPHRQ